MTYLKTFGPITANQYGFKKINYSYFLDFSSKEEYLAKRQEWREIYKFLSEELRHNKQVHKWQCRRYSNHKKPIIFPDPFPVYKKYACDFINPVKMLEIRHQQKVLSKEQREKALVA